MCCEYNRTLSRMQVVGTVFHLFIMCVKVESTDAAYKELTDKGFEFVAPPVDADGNRIAFFKGPDNIIIEVFQPL